ncbi:hypothetical protein ACK2IE_22460 [Clostridioides difficile]
MELEVKVNGDLPYKKQIISLTLCVVASQNFIHNLELFHKMESEKLSDNIINDKLYYSNISRV